MRAVVQRGRTPARRILLPLVSVALLLTAAAGAALPTEDQLAAPTFLKDGGLAWSNENSPAGGAGWGIGGSDELLVVTTLGDGTLQSTSQGASWTPLAPFPIIEAQAIVADPTDSAHVLVAGFGGLARTSDAGATWEHLINNPRSAVLAVSPTGRIAVSERFDGFNNRILVSDDGGATWTDVNAPVGSFSLYGLAFGLHDDNIVVASIGRTWVTTDGGASWTEEERGLLDLVRDEDGTLWRAGMGPFDKSTDGGVTWTEVTGAGSPRALAPRTGGGVYAATSDGILFTTDGGASWTNMGHGEVSWAVTGMVADPTGIEGVLISHEGLGVVWVGSNGAGGHRMESRTTGFPPVDLLSLGASGDGSLLLAGGPLGLYASRDEGATWGHTGAGFGFQGVRATTANVDGAVVYAGGQTLFFWPFLFYSQDGGYTWDYADVNIGGDGRVVAIVAHPEESLTAFAVVWGELTQSRVLRTMDGGSTWDSILVSEDRLHDGAWHAPTGTLLVATDTGVLAWFEDLDEWLPVLATGTATHALAATGDHVYAGGPGAGIWRTVPLLPVLAPWGDASGVQALAAGPGDGVGFAVAATSVQVCRPGDLGVLALCEPDSPPAGSFRDVLVTPDGTQVLVASQGAGLWAAPIPSG